MLEKIGDEIDLIRRHLLVARAVVAHEPIGIIKLSDVLGEPQHRVRYSLRVLEQMGYIRASPLGAYATPEAKEMLASLSDELDLLIGTLEAMKRDSIANV